VWRHAEELNAIILGNREHLSRWLPRYEDEPVDETRDSIIRGLEQFAHGTGLQAGIWFRGKLVGVIGVQWLDHYNRRTSIDYWVAQAFEGQGLVTRACRAVIAYLFTERGLNRVEIRCAMGNKRSRAIPQRLGFTQEAVLREAQRLGEGFTDIVVYGMLRSEWESRLKGETPPASARLYTEVEQILKQTGETGEESR
jgi:ribosomal-protein-serine acetyltransferase